MPNAVKLVFNRLVVLMQNNVLNDFVGYVTVINANPSCPFLLFLFGVSIVC